MKDDWAGPAQREEGFLLLLPPQQQVTVWDEGTLTQTGPGCLHRQDPEQWEAGGWHSQLRESLPGMSALLHSPPASAPHILSTDCI